MLSFNIGSSISLTHTKVAIRGGTGWPPLVLRLLCAPPSMPSFQVPWILLFNFRNNNGNTLQRLSPASYSYYDSGGHGGLGRRFLPALLLGSVLCFSVPALLRTLREKRMNYGVSFVTKKTTHEVVAHKSGGYEKGGVVTYMVMDDLVVQPTSFISSITLVNKFNVKEVGALHEKVV
ncbi:DUF674 family protein [Senna tora]|uniref:DUF674 family protein n=1 Tax=Senna tora TaxID=362788 RepID=A0A834T6M5_9FABA|nr:DUF674 family protein [Senna tora]